MRAFLVLALVALGCGESGPSGDVPERLSAWGLFADPLAQAPAEGVEPYAPVSPLFSDYTAKHRFIRLPEGVPAGYTAEGPWDFPEGTVLVKTFAFPADRRDPSAGERLVETRLLVLEDGEWEPYVYLWEGDDAHYEPAGARVPVSWVHDDGAERSLTYRVPNTSQCAECHGGIGDTLPLGPRTQQMDHDGQLAALEAAQSGLWLTADVTDDLALGLCKRPVAAGHAAGGHSFDIVPGAPDESVMIYRMESTEPGVKMPELPNQLVDEAGVALVREWIASMSPEGC